jgi:predicted nucleic acid-binding protein
LSLYLDASVLVPMFIDDAFSERADLLLRVSATEVLVSDFASAELASAINRRVRMRQVAAEEGRKALTNFDSWIGQLASRVEIASADVAKAAAFLRRLDLNLRTPDAIHIATAQRLDADLATFDERMAESARSLGARVRVA